MVTIKSFTFNPFQENTYVLYNEKREAIIIDPGMYDKHEFEFFFDFLENESLNPILLLNTHTHLDHIFGNAAVQSKFSIPLAFHELETPVFNAASSAGALYNLPFEKSPEPNFYIKEGEEITLGEDRFEILLTPGHSPGSVCFYNKKQQFVISGDVLFQLSVGRSDLPGGNPDELFNSIHSKLFTLPNEVEVFSGHGPKTQIGFEKMNNPFMKG